MPRVVILDPPPAVEALLEQRRRSGADRHDEMWDGVLHMAPAPRDVHAVLAQQLAELLGPLARAAGLTPSAEFNLGVDRDYRVPDLGLHRDPSWGTFAASAALVVEILSPGDETLDKLSFYASHHVDEVLIIDPEQRAVRWLALTSAAGYSDIERSTALNVSIEELATRLDWPRRSGDRAR